MKCRRDVAPVDDIVSPAHIGGIAGRFVLQVKRVLILLNAQTVMHDVVVHQGSLHILHVDTIVREAIAFIALDQRAAGVAVDLDAVVAITIADFVVQELRTVGMAIVVFGKHELVMVARVAISCVVDRTSLNRCRQYTSRDRH